ncbi:MAG: isoleucine--tRNA ligase [Verrucomicrobia bacterium]|nr:isoleucine--tRNA ligase [Verrucomicrobiota bacterium]
MYEAVNNRPDFPGLEKAILEFWRKNQTFEKSLELRKGQQEFVFYDGPPFATGLPHYGHLLAGTIKDIVPRYQTMRGKYVERRFGWDCHGLPVECEVEQDLKISGKTEIEKLGVGVFNDRCRSIVLRYTREWREVVTRMGRWVDFDHDYKTMDASYMESIWWVFKSLWDKGLVYEGRKILPFCPRCSTPLSNFETNQGYEDVTDPAITVRFKLEGAPNEFILAWTTTPWTLPSNMALAVGRDITYARIVDKDAVYYMAKDLVTRYYKKPEDYSALTELKGSELVGRTYEPLFPYFAHHKKDGAFRVLAGDFVSTEDGTGVVHIAPGFGEDDYKLGLAEKIPAVCPIDEEGKFIEPVSDYLGRSVKETDADIMKRLKEERKLVHRATITHSYPHCWRCDTPLIYRALATWFVRVEQMRDRIVAANKQIRWVPEHLRDGRFGKWLEGARDWAISRNRYWGAPIPVWQSADGKESVCVGSIAELESLSGRKVSDLHKQYVDEVEIASKSGKGRLRRVPQVLDCWFESGSMPYAQAHYPFENREHFESHFPADFIAEGLDQTRGWFYTLMVLSVALFDKPAFRNVIVNGLVLAEDGRKMSKRLKNYPDPAYMLDTYGADAVRLYLIYSPVVKAEDLRFSEEGVKHLMRHILIPLWNAYSFFVQYANIDGWTSSRMLGNRPLTNTLDRWIMSSLESLSADVTEAMDRYDLQQSVRPFVGFIDNLTNWYIRRSRRRFWKSQDDDDKAQAYQTLNYVLLQLSKIAAPFVPFMSESIYRNLRTKDMPESVHLCDFPTGDNSRRDLELEKKMALVMTVVKMGRQLRSEHDLKVRQPLSKIHIVSRDAQMLKLIRDFEDIIREELNVKEAVYSSRDSELAALKAKPDFKKLGPRLGGKMKKAAQVIAAMDLESVERLEGGETVTITVDGAPVAIEPGDIVIDRIPHEGLVVKSEGALVIALEKELTRDLVLEGLAREIVNKVQNKRKTDGLEVTQRIQRKYHSDADVIAAETAFAGYINSETLCVGAESMAQKPADPAGWEQLDINGHEYWVQIAPVSQATDEAGAARYGVYTEE